VVNIYFWCSKVDAFLWDRIGFDVSDICEDFRYQDDTNGAGV